jgi:hydrogenase maturation protease
VNNQTSVLVLGIGNVLWADEGFGVRAVEALHARYAYPASQVRMLDGGTLGLNLLDYIESARRVLVFDAIDFDLAPGSIKVLRDAEVPRWGARKLSPHQNGFNDVLALAQLHDRTPQEIVAIGVQPKTLDDFGGSLTEPVRARLADAVELAALELARWQMPGRRRVPGEPVEPLSSSSLQLDEYESGRPSADDACRIGDERLLRGVPDDRS